MKDIHSLTAINNKEMERNLYYYLIILISIFLNQTSIIGGINFSLSDLLIPFLLFFLIYKGIQVPTYHFMYFLFLSVAIVATAVFYTPYKFGVNLDINLILKEYLKLFAVFLYLLAGYNFVHEKAAHVSLKWYSYAALFIGLLGILINVLGMKFFYQIYDFGEYRYNGFMNDPNYFAIIQISALPFFFRSKNLSLRTKVIIYFIMVFSILLSGSKTGFITLLLYTMFFVFSKVIKNKFKLKTILFSVSAFVFFSILGVALQTIQPNFTLNSDKYVQFQRIFLLFTNFDAAFNDNGSGRLPIWMAGIHLISLSPLFGVGVGMYSGASEKVSGIGMVAHNTYIQIYSEWGGLFATIIFLYIAVVLIQVTFKEKVKNETNFILRDLLIILLIGSIAISLNNARMFWFFLGVLVYRISGKQLTKLPSHIT